MFSIDLNNKLPKNFYTRNVLTVAPELLGKIFVYNSPHGILAGKIVEVEAYDGSIDQAAHTFTGITKRNKIMFKRGGYLYVYFTYGVHHCCNVVCGKENEGQAVLIRAMEPLIGIEQMSVNRFGTNHINSKQKVNLLNGPGKICQALTINRLNNGDSLLDNNIFIINQGKINKNSVVITRRIGIKKSVDLPWRFYIKDNPYISKK